MIQGTAEKMNCYRTRPMIDPPYFVPDLGQKVRWRKVMFNLYVADDPRPCCLRKACTADKEQSHQNEVAVSNHVDTVQNSSLDRALGHPLSAHYS